MSKVDFDKQLQDLARLKKIPLNGEFEITSRCNLNCVMCYTRKSPNNQDVISKEMSKDEIIELASNARDAGMMYLLLTGGEIFIRKDFKEIYKALSEMGLVITLFTNGTLITEEIAEWLGQRPPKLVSITLYGASSDMYKQITGVESGFEAAIRGIDFLIQYGINVEVKTTWVKGNVKDYYQLYDIARERGLKLKVVNYIFPSKDAESSNPVGERLDPVELAKMEIEIEKHARKVFENEISLNDKLNINEPTPILEATNIQSLDSFMLNDSAFDCEAGHSSFTVSWDGYVTPCSLMQSIKYHNLDMPFTELFRSMVDACNQLKRSYICDDCVHKEECFPCPARRLIETGDVEGVPEYLCKHAKARTSLLNS